MVYRVHKDKNYTTMSNYHLRDKNLSFKAKGLLSFMLSLSDDWNYRERGFQKFSTDKLAGIRSGIHELEEKGYLIRTRERDEKGHLKECVYDVYEFPILRYAMDNDSVPNCENPNFENRNLENRTLRNTKYKEILNKRNTNEFERVVTPKKIKDYCSEKGYSIDCDEFYEYYSNNGWTDKNGKPLISWKAAVISWAKNRKYQNSKGSKKKTANPSFDIEQLERALRESDEVI